MPWKLVLMRGGQRRAAPALHRLRDRVAERDARLRLKEMVTEGSWPGVVDRQRADVCA